MIRGLPEARLDLAQMQREWLACPSMAFLDTTAVPALDFELSQFGVARNVEQI